MEALQYIYTSWKNGDSTEKGYMIYSRSEGISEAECNAIKDAMQYLARPFQVLCKRLKLI